MKEDKLVTYYFKSIDYINQNSKVVYGVALGIIAVIVLSYMFMGSRRTAEINASVELTKARAEIDNANHVKAIDILKNMIINYGGTENAGRGTFYLANILFEQNKPEEAIEYYKEYLDDYEDDIIISSSSYSGLGACYEEMKNYEQAANYYLKGAKKYSEHFEAPGLLMSAGRCYKLVNNNEKAKNIYQKVVADYPKTRFKQDAEVYINQL